MKNLNAYAGNPIATPPVSSRVVDRIYLTLVYNVRAALEGRGVNVLD